MIFQGQNYVPDSLATKHGDSVTLHILPLHWSAGPQKLFIFYIRITVMQILQPNIRIDVMLFMQEQMMECCMHLMEVFLIPFTTSFAEKFRLHTIRMTAAQQMMSLASQVPPCRSSEQNSGLMYHSIYYHICIG